MIRRLTKYDIIEACHESFVNQHLWHNCPCRCRGLDALTEAANLMQNRLKGVITEDFTAVNQLDATLSMNN